MPIRRSALFLTVTLSAVPAAAPVLAGERLDVAGMPCIRAVDRAGGPGRGIATDEPAPAVVVQLCDGG